MPTPRTRRSQAERSEATQQALLDATIESLIEVGWAATSTRAVAERAGVSQGAQQHHYPTKAALVEAAIDRLLERLGTAADTLETTPGTERDRAAQLLDLLWAVHTMPVNSAILEIMAVARIDPAGPKVARQLVDATDLACDLAARVLPGYARLPGFRQTVLLALAVLRGTAIALMPGTESARPDWPGLRTHLLETFDRLARDPGAAATPSPAPETRQ